MKAWIVYFNSKISFLHVYGIILGSPVFHLKHSITTIGRPSLPMIRPFHQFPTTRPAFLRSKTLLLVVQSINHSEEKHCQQLNMIDRLPAKHFTMHPPQRNCEDFPAGGKFCRFPLWQLPSVQDSRLPLSCDCPSVTMRAGLTLADAKLAQ